MPLVLLFGIFQLMGSIMLNLATWRVFILHMWVPSILWLFPRLFGTLFGIWSVSLNWSISGGSIAKIFFSRKCSSSALCKICFLEVEWIEHLLFRCSWTSLSCCGERHLLMGKVKFKSMCLVHLDRNNFLFEGNSISEFFGLVSMEWIFCQEALEVSPSSGLNQSEIIISCDNRVAHVMASLASGMGLLPSSANGWLVVCLISLVIKRQKLGQFSKICKAFIFLINFTLIFG